MEWGTRACIVADLVHSAPLALLCRTVYVSVPVGYAATQGWTCGTTSTAPPSSYLLLNPQLYIKWIYVATIIYQRCRAYSSF